jgi:hypothetical protein
MLNTLGVQLALLEEVTLIRRSKYLRMALSSGTPVSKQIKPRHDAHFIPLVIWTAF